MLWEGCVACVQRILESQVRSSNSQFVSLLPFHVSIVELCVSDQYLLGGLGRTVFGMFNESLIPWTSIWSLSQWPRPECPTEAWITEGGQEPVSSASVNLTTESSIFSPVSDTKVAPGWQKDLGQALAKHLTSCGFESNLRGQPQCSSVGRVVMFWQVLMSSAKY